MTGLPMLASASTGASGRDPVDLDRLMATGDWTLDLKLDGERAFLMPDGKILNRKGADITSQFPEIDNPTGLWLDGEIVALNGSFESVLSRSSQVGASAIMRGANVNPCRFVAFDMPDVGGVEWLIRRSLLEQVAAETGLPTTVVSQDRAFFDQVRELGMEGVIAKRRTSRYQFGRRSKDWVKFKHLFRVSCLVAGYAPGSGSREHFGALVLALLDDDGQAVSVGRCGSGFTDKQTHELRDRIDAGDLLVAEIETVNVTSGGTLRFPVFRGLRADVAPSDCTIDQLAALPRC